MPTMIGSSGNLKSNACCLPAQRKNITVSVMCTMPPASAFTPHREAASVVLAPAFCMNRRLSPMPPTPAGVMRLTNDPASPTSKELPNRTGTGQAASMLSAAPR